MLIGDDAAAATLRAGLGGIGWEAVCTQAGFTGELRHAWSFEIADGRLTAAQTLLAALLIEGRRVAAAAAEAWLGTAFVDALARTGLARIADGEIVLPEFALLLLRGKCLAVSRRTAAADLQKPIAYAGPDSLMMADRAARYGGANALDLCAGAGLLALKVSERFARVDACEIAAPAADAARFNALLNGVSGKVFVTTANAMDYEPPGAVDFIIANPPFMPWLTDDTSLSFAAGGLNGFEFALALMRRAMGWLRPQGRALVLTGTLGGGAKETFLRQLAALADRFCLAISAVKMDARPAADLSLIAGLPADLAREYREGLAQDAGACLFEAYLLMAQKAARPKVRLLDNWQSA